MLGGDSDILGKEPTKSVLSGTRPLEGGGREETQVAQRGLLGVGTGKP